METVYLGDAIVTKNVVCCPRSRPSSKAFDGDVVTLKQKVEIVGQLLCVDFEFFSFQKLGNSSSKLSVAFEPDGVGHHLQRLRVGCAGGC